MSPDEPEPLDRARSHHGRLRRSGRQLVRLGAVLTAISLVVVLLAGWATRSLLDDLQTNSAELLDGTATVQLPEGAQRTLYVTGGLVAPGELAPTPVEQISCTITGPGGPLPFESLADQGKKVGIDTVLARLQVVGSFQAQDDGDHQLDCDGLGLVVAPEVEPASVIVRLGGLVLSSLGVFLGLTMLVIGGALMLLLRGGGAEEDAIDEVAAPPEEGADEWWEDEAGPGGHGGPADTAGKDTAGEDDYVDVSEEELAAMSDEEIDELVRSGALVFVDDDEAPVDGGEPDPEPDPDPARR